MNSVNGSNLQNKAMERRSLDIRSNLDNFDFKVTRVES